MKILIVDDETISRQKLNVLLSKQGKCDMASSGEQALEFFRQALESGKPYDLVTLDYDMPGLTGPEVLRKIRDFETEQGITSRSEWVKVMMVTSKNDCTSVMASFKSGCEGYLTKPFNLEDVTKSLTAIGV